jgi:glycosyltransferase involved in cell wall biosynthesis
MIKLPKISIITPTRNAGKTLEACILSVVNQTYLNKEYIIIDGLSTDGTLGIVKKYADIYPYIKWISEKDEGIYNAMNKGIDLSSGEWIYFLGADDSFYSDGVLDDIFNQEDISNFDVIYGNVQWGNAGREYDGQFSKLDLLQKNICHQAIFTRKSVFDKIGKFDTNYKIWADWVFNMKWFNMKYIRHRYINKIIAKYGLGGMSSNSYDSYFLQNKDSLIETHFPEGYKIFSSMSKQLEDKDHKIAELEHVLTVLFTSRSWRVTRPLRGIGAVIRKLRDMLGDWGRIKRKLYGAICLKKNTKLIMTLLVRDEEDIIEKNIRFHLNHGVDFIIATDNGSVDGTRGILKKYENKGLLHLIDEKIQDYSQAEWVNRMGKLAYEKYNADIIFHCDADEFWFSKRRNLKNEILKKQNVDVLRVNLVNVLLEDKQGLETFPGDSKWAVVNPYETQNCEEDTKNKNLYLFRSPQKVIYKTENGYLDVVSGNHDVVATEKLTTNGSKDIIIYHYPVRSRKQFFRKAKNGGSAFELNKRLDKSIGFHTRRWFESYKNNRLEDEYRNLLLKRENVVILEKENVIQKINFEEIFT